MSLVKSLPLAEAAQVDSEAGEDLVFGRAFRQAPKAPHHKYRAAHRDSVKRVDNHALIL